MTDSIEPLVRAVLYEGYALYPYRPSALKNRKRFAFGAIHPRDFRGEVSELRAEVVVVAPATASLAVTIRFLVLARGGGAREEAIELAVPIAGGAHLAATRAGIDLEIDATVAAAGDVRRVAIEIANVTPLAPGADREDAMDITAASTHVVIRVDDGAALSAIDPPAEHVDAVAACRSVGLYPVLVGPRAILASPIILPDFPELAAPSPGDFFDGTEMDEMLTLRVLTMTDAEKREAADADPRIAALLARTEALGIEATARLHGIVRTVWPREGTRVRVHPRGRADAFDVVLAGKLAVVVAVERDLEGGVHCAVAFDDDPGADLAIGHRFYFRPDELEVVA